MDLQFDLWPKQQEALLSPARELLYGGAAGPGKSHLMRVAFIVWACAIAGLQIFLFRRHYKDLINNHLEGPTGFRAMLAPLVEAKRCTITDQEICFPFGDGKVSRITLNHCQHEKDVFNHWGSEMHVLGIEEATQFTETMVRYLRTRVRMPTAIELPVWAKGLFPRVLYTTNPGGPGHAYFRNAFVNAAPAGTIFTAPEDDGGFTRQYIPARLNDNPSVNPVEYAKTLAGMGSPEYVRALLEGDWDAVVGAFFDVFSRSRHVVPQFSPPPHWTKYRAFDWGSYAPFAVLWICVSDGQYFVDARGVKRRYPRGALIVYREWYGNTPLKQDGGCDMSNRDMALGIKQRTPEPGRWETVTDSLPFQDRGGKTIATEFEEHGVPLTEGDTSRIPGWKAMRDRLVGIEGFPLLYFTDSCVNCIRTIPLLQRKLSDPDDVEDGSPDHCADAVRLACMAWSFVTDAAKENTRPVDEGPTFNQVMQRHIRLKTQASGSGY